MELKAKHGRYWYKSDLAWLKAVYRRNKSVIDSTYGDLTYTTPYKAFKARVMEMGKDQYVVSKYGSKKGKVSLSSKVKALSRTTKYTTVAERMQSNAYYGLKKFKGLEQLREMSGDKKIQRSKIKYDPDTHMYYYESKKNNTKIYWDYLSSPERVVYYTREELNGSK